MALQKREKILLILAMVAVIVFIFTTVLPDKSQKNKPETGTQSIPVEVPKPLQAPRSTSQSTSLKSYSPLPAWNLEWKNDPFVYSKKPEDEKRIADSLLIEPKVSFELTGISWLNGKPTVLINDKILKPGDKIDGYTLSVVKPEYVILMGKGEQIRLTFSEGTSIPESFSGE